MTFSGFTARRRRGVGGRYRHRQRSDTGRHIIKVEKNGVASYQVVTARGISYDLYDEDGNQLAADARTGARYEGEGAV